MGARSNTSDRNSLWRISPASRRSRRRGRFGPAIALAAALGTGCLERPIDAGAQVPAGTQPSTSSAAGIGAATDADLCEVLGPELCKLAGSVTLRSAANGRQALLIVYTPERAEPTSAASAPPGPARAEITHTELRSKRGRVSGDALPALDQELREAEAEFPLEFRFSYERASLAVFGKREHHEAFRLLRRAAEKAIETQDSDAMLEMLGRDGARNGAFWKLARGHGEWNAIHEALEHRDRERLRPVHGHTVLARQDPPQAPSLENALARLRVMRERMGRPESERHPELADH